MAKQTWLYYIIIINILMKSREMGGKQHLCKYCGYVPFICFLHTSAIPYVSNFDLSNQNENQSISENSMCSENKKNTVSTIDNTNSFLKNCQQLMLKEEGTFFLTGMGSGSENATRPIPAKSSSSSLSGGAATSKLEKSTRPTFLSQKFRDILLY